MDSSPESAKFEDILNRFGQLVYPNKGTSMMPLLRQGRDLMVIDKKGSEPCKKYDAVLFRRPTETGTDAYVLHRILRVNTDGTYWIVGDNCRTGDIVRDEQILGILSAVVRGGKTIPVTNRGYRAYVALWCGCYPLRFAAIHAKQLGGSCLRRMNLRK